MNSNRLIVCFPLLCVGIFASVMVLGWYKSKDPDPARYAHQIVAFKASDQSISRAEGPVVFVGSSSIRGWNLGEGFPGLPAINRGFGGAEISDVIFYLEEVVLKHNPSVVVLYAGENDVAGSKSTSQVLKDYRRFVDAVTKHSIETDIIYISIKPSPARWNIWPKMRQANENIRLYSNCYRDYHFADIAEGMLDENLEPNALLYANDGIHMTAEGYAIWTERLRPLVEQIYKSETVGI